MALARETNGLPTQTEARLGGEAACWTWLPPQPDAAAAAPPVLALSARALEPAAGEQLGHEMEVPLTLLPLRVVLFVDIARSDLPWYLRLLNSFLLNSKTPADLLWEPAASASASKLYFILLRTCV